MPMLRIERFGGMIPLRDDRLLDQEHAAHSENADVQSGAIKCVSSLVPIYEVQDPTTRSVFRIPRANPGIDNMRDSVWLEFENENTWVVRNPTSGLSDGGRFYWADGSNPPGYTTGDRAIAGDPPLILGIPAPDDPPSILISGGAPPTETRAYVYTWVSAYGEEGQPSPADIDTGNADGTWAITLVLPTGGDLTGRNLVSTRIYRTVTSTQGVATFHLVDTVPIATVLYNDTIPTATVVLNAQLESTDWAQPPAGLNGLVNMPNGMIAGFVGDEVWFSVPYRPWAWPPQYVLGVESPIVGLGVQQQSLVICTVGWTYIATGIRPDAMTLSKVANLEPCTSMGSIVSAPEGVMYTSVNGLIICSAGVEVNGTADLIRKDQWPKLLYLPNLHATYLNRTYIAFSAPSDGVFQADAFQTEDDPPGEAAFAGLDFTGTRDGATINLADARLGFGVLTSNVPVQNVLKDIWTGEILLLRDGIVDHLDLRQSAPRLPYRWRSKIFQTPYVENWAAAKVFFTQPPGPPPDAPTVFRFFADGRKVYEYKLNKSGEQFRLPSGFKSDTIQFELEGQLVIQNVQIATSARELRQA